MERWYLNVLITTCIGASFDQQNAETSASESRGDWSASWATSDDNVVKDAWLIEVVATLPLSFRALMLVMMVFDLVGIVMPVLLRWNCQRRY